VSWGDVIVFIHILNNAEGTWKYRLPTEAEWEYAARAGTTTRYWFGDDAAKLDEVAWYQDNSLQQTHPVGQKKPNPWGLYDMYGNVVEWVSDWWGEYSGKKNQTDPRGPVNIPLIIKDRVIRGGGWEDVNVNSYARGQYYINWGRGIGFRLAFTPDEHDLVENRDTSQREKSK
jgi:formylglycine-generating enzyme required for sulfatase activity